MPQEFEGDLAGAEFWGADLQGATFRDVNLTGVRISHAWMVDVDVDALVERLVVNGVDVTDFVNERDPWYPLRSWIRPPADPQAARDAWAALEAAWSDTMTVAATLPEDALHQSVNGEWSFVQTLRHLVLAMDKWFTVPVLGGSFTSIGLVHTGSTADSASLPGVDPTADPTLAEALAVRAEQAARLRAHLASLDPAELDRTVDVPDAFTCPVRECLFTVFEEEFWHNRYARRDLGLLGAAGL
jgi:hypothetical protein